MGNPSSLDDRQKLPVQKLPVQKRIIFAILRFFFKLLYHQLSWTYDGVAWIVSSGAWRTWVQSCVPFLPGPKVLEIGFGPGHLLASLHQVKVTAFGLDESRQMVRIASRRLARISTSPGLVRGQAEALPFKSHCINQVVMTFPAEFVFKQATLEEIRRVLVPGGKALVLAIAWITGRKLWQRAIAWVNRITGQAPSWDEKLLEPLRSLRFEVTWEMIDFPSSRALVIQLIKPDSS